MDLRASAWLGHQSLWVHTQWCLSDVSLPPLLGTYCGYCHVTRLSQWACSSHWVRLPSPRTTHISPDRKASCVPEAGSWQWCVRPLPHAHTHAASTLLSEPPSQPLYLYHCEVGSQHLVQADLEPTVVLPHGTQARTIILRGSVFLAYA